MSKTFIYSLLVIGVFILIVFPKYNTGLSEKVEEEETQNTDNPNSVSEFDLENETDENGVSKGASGRMKYQIGGYVK